jgi:hypothetical protein
LFSKFFGLLGLSFASLIRVSEGFLYFDVEEEEKEEVCRKGGSEWESP